MHEYQVQKDGDVERNYKEIKQILEMRESQMLVSFTLTKKSRSKELASNS